MNSRRVSTFPSSQSRSPPSGASGEPGSRTGNNSLAPGGVETFPRPRVGIPVASSQRMRVQAVLTPRVSFDQGLNPATPLSGPEAWVPLSLGAFLLSVPNPGCRCPSISTGTHHSPSQSPGVAARDRHRDRDQEPHQRRQRENREQHQGDTMQQRWLFNQATMGFAGGRSLHRYAAARCPHNVYCSQQRAHRPLRAASPDPARQAAGA